jgi:hypothetical protein
MIIVDDWFTQQNAVSALNTLVQCIGLFHVI